MRRVEVGRIVVWSKMERNFDWVQERWSSDLRLIERIVVNVVLPKKNNSVFEVARGFEYPMDLGIVVDTALSEVVDLAG